MMDFIGRAWIPDGEKAHICQWTKNPLGIPELVQTKEEGYGTEHSLGNGLQCYNI